MRASAVFLAVVALMIGAANSFTLHAPTPACRSLTRTSASSDATPVSSKATSPSQIQVDEARDKKMALYAELFELDVSGDVRRHAAKQIAAGKKPFFVVRREKVALYDKLFSSGTVSSDKLVKDVERISSGKIKTLVEVEGMDGASVFRPRLGVVEW